MSDKKMTAKGAIQIGIYSALYFVVAGVVGSIGYIPVLYPAAPFAIAVAAGPVFFFFLLKVRHFGMITLMAILGSAALALTGHGLYCLAAGPVFGLIADLICKKGNYRNFRTLLWGYAVFSLLMPTSYLAMLLAAQDFYKNVSGMISPEYAENLKNVMQGWVFIIVFAGAFVGGILGAFLGRAVTRRRFAKQNKH